MTESPDSIARLNAVLGGRYTLGRELGRGGMATVYLATDRKHDRQVAIKVLHPELSVTLGAERFLREIQIEAKLNHPHILPLHDSGHANGFLYYVMPYVEGESLRDRLNREGRLSVEEALRISKEAATALDYAHEQGLVHRDIKPENILLSAGQAVVADFGIARAVDEAGGEQLTATGVSVGTPAYMSPEQAAGERKIDSRTDLYALGCVLYEMLTGEPPFAGPSPQVVMARKVSEPAPGLKDKRDGVSEELEAIVLKALARKPEDRYETAGDLDHALTAGLPRAEWVREGRRSRVQTLSITAVAVVLLGLVGWWAYGALFSSGPGLERLILLSPELPADTALHAYVEGQHRDLNTALGQISGLERLSRTTALAYRDTDLTIPEIAAERNVGSVVEMWVEVSADSVWISVEVYTALEESLWNGTLGEPLESVQSLHNQVALAIAEHVGAVPTPEEENRLAIARSVDPAAYDAYQRGWHLLESRDPANLSRAKGYFEEAIERDSTFALAYAALGKWYGLLTVYYMAPPTEMMPRARDLAEKALALDSTLAEAHGELADVQFRYDWDREAAEESFLRALELNPNYAFGHQSYGQMLVYLGRTEEGLEYLRRAAELDPLAPAPSTFLGVGLMFAREYDEAVQVLDEVLGRHPDYAFGHFFRAGAYNGAGRYADALVEFERAIEIAGRLPIILAPMAATYAKSGRTSKANELLEELLRLRATGETYVSGERLAVVYAGLGQHDKAIEWLNRAYGERDPGLLYVKTYYVWDPLRRDPRFQELMRKVFGEYADE
jgi:serine/threonine-protein kinase